MARQAYCVGSEMYRQKPATVKTKKCNYYPWIATNDTLKLACTTSAAACNLQCCSTERPWRLLRLVRCRPGCSPSEHRLRRQRPARRRRPAPRGPKCGSSAAVLTQLRVEPAQCAYLSIELLELAAGFRPVANLDGDGARVDVRRRRVQHGQKLVRRGFRGRAP